MTPLSKLKAIAEGATEQAPAKWVAGAEREDGTAQVYMPNDGPLRRVVPLAETSGPLARYIAAASPDVVLGLIAEVRRLREAVRLIAGLPLPPEVSAKVAEADRLRKLFDDAGEGQYNVLNLVESYQRSSMDAEERLRAVRKLLEENGCECPCDHHWEERGPECEVCLACLVGEVVGK